jgi:hypothetical protein
MAKPSEAAVAVMNYLAERALPALFGGIVPEAGP